MRMFTVDCFTDRPFAGNPAAVCILDSWPTTAWLQHLAAELNTPATAFVRRANPRTQLRWFSPTTELELCGHGTLAASHVLRQLGDHGETLAFDTCGGVLGARYEPDGRIALDFPVDTPRRVPASPELAAALGATPVAVSRGRLDLIAELDSAHTVRALAPDFTALAGFDARGIIVTAAADTDSDSVSRFFAPAAGIDEDPVTGSAHCSLGPYWSPRLGKTELTGFQVSARGGRVDVHLRGDRVQLLGRAVTVTRGELAIEPG